MIAPSVEVSILPPETTQTSLPLPARPDRAAARDAAPAPSATVRARSMSSRIASATAARLTAIEPSRGSRARVPERVQEGALHPGVGPGPEDLEPSRNGHFDGVRAKAPDRVELRFRRRLGDHDGAGEASFPSVPGDRLRHIPRAGGPEAARECLGVDERDGIPGAAQLERPDRLKVLELEEDLRRRVDLEADERGSDDRVRDPLSGSLDIRVRRRLVRVPFSHRGSFARWRFSGWTSAARSRMP